MKYSGCVSHRFDSESVVNNRVQLYLASNSFCDNLLLLITVKGTVSAIGIDNSQPVDVFVIVSRIL